MKRKKGREERRKRKKKKKKKYGLNFSESKSYLQLLTKFWSDTAKTFVSNQCFIFFYIYFLLSFLLENLFFYYLYIVNNTGIATHCSSKKIRCNLDDSVYIHVGTSGGVMVNKLD